jgi:hypothetical protein
MSINPEISEFRVEKSRSHATLTLSSGDTVLGCFFVAGSSAHAPAGPERVGELLNAESGFFPFEVHDRGSPRAVLFNRAQVVTVALAANEAQQDPGYDVATTRLVAMRLSNGRKLVGTVRVYRPEKRDRLSDWARQSDQFRYVESDQMTLIVNVAHVIEVSEVTSS